MLPQLIFFILVAIVWSGLLRVRFARIRRFAPHAYVTLIVFLLLTLAFGRLAGGATRWISVGGLFNIQISQIAIPAVALFIPWVLEKGALERWEGLLAAVGIVLLPTLLIFVEPDLSTSIILLLSIGTAIFFSPVALRKIGIVLGIGLLSAIVSWFFVLQPYQKARVLSFAGIDQQPAATYNATQSQIAVGSGQLLGRGLGQGVQSHLRFLPERQTDFIFASLAEELGFFGTIFVISCYAFLALASFRIAEQSSEWPAAFFAYGISAYIAIQTVINIGMNIGLVPVTGVTLPFLSYGGSSLLANALSLGILSRIALEHERPSLRHIR